MATESKSPNLAYVTSGGYVGGGKYFTTPVYSPNSYLLKGSLVSGPTAIQSELELGTTATGFPSATAPTQTSN